MKHHFHIIIPTYNRADTIIRAIDSVINQDYDTYNIYIVDDGSTDHTQDILEKYWKAYEDKITYVYKENGWVGSARNIWIEYALKNVINDNKEWIVFLDSDDELSSDAFLSMNQILVKYPGYKLYFTKSYDQNGNTYSHSKIDYEEIDYQRWLLWVWECGFFCSIPLFRKYRYIEIVNGGESLLWNQIFKDHHPRKIGIYINEFAIRIYYTDTESLCRVKKRTDVWLQNSLKIQELLIEKFWSDYQEYVPRRYGEIMLIYAQYLTLDGKKIQSIKYFFYWLRYRIHLSLIILYIIGLVDYNMKINNFLLNKK